MELWLFGCDNSYHLDYFSLFHTLLWDPCNYLLLGWAKCFPVSKMLPFHIVWSCFSGKTCVLFFLSYFSEPSDTSLLPSVFSHTDTDNCQSCRCLVYCYLLVFEDLWAYFVSRLCCKSCFVLPYSLLLFLCEIIYKNILLYKHEVIPPKKEQIVLFWSNMLFSF